MNENRNEQAVASQGEQPEADAKMVKAYYPTEINRIVAKILATTKENFDLE